jgi:hypothetical protein
VSDAVYVVKFDDDYLIEGPGKRPLSMHQREAVRFSCEGARTRAACDGDLRVVKLVPKQPPPVLWDAERACWVLA